MGLNHLPQAIASNLAVPAGINDTLGAAEVSVGANRTVVQVVHAFGNVDQQRHHEAQVEDLGVVWRGVVGVGCCGG